MTQPIWNPHPDDIARSRLRGFMDFVGGNFGGYDDIHRWSVEHAEAFWSAVWDYCGVVGDRGAEVIRPMDIVPYARFFPDSQISFAENMLAQADKTPDAAAIIARCQDGDDRILRWAELCDQVSVWQQALEGLGVGEGDKVAVYLPNVPETVVILLAASNIGAVFASAGMEMGADDLVNRFAQVAPKILIAQDGYTHGEKQVSRVDVAQRARAEIKSVERVIMLGDDSQDLLAAYSPQKLTYTRRDFNHPLYILFSSGSTGKPKCFEHSSGGVLLKHLCEYQLNSDVHAGDVVFYHATPSWMMWNWLASGLASGATILMYDGNPFYPDSQAQWDFTAAHRCTHHGTAAPIILAWEKQGLDLTARTDMDALRCVMSTGAVLPEQSFRYIHRAIKADVKIATISGGTDLVGCFLGGDVFDPTYEGAANGAMLGCDVQVWDDDGNALSPSCAGELVCVNAFPSMPLRFLNDPDGARYEEEYFSYYSGKKVWRHGDTIEKTAQGQYVVVGRSDATLNQNGVRIGPIAIYEQLEAFRDEIDDYAAVDFTRPDNKQAITILFLVCADLTDNLCGKVKKAVKDNVTPYAIPSEILQVEDILRTPNGKTAEVVMKKILAGKDVPNASLYGEELVALYQKIGRELQAKYSEEEAA